jgi:hypothetical protein
MMRTELLIFSRIWMELYDLFRMRSDEEGTRGIYTQEINSKG